MIQVQRSSSHYTARNQGFGNIPLLTDPYSRDCPAKPERDGKDRDERTDASQEFSEGYCQNRGWGDMAHGICPRTLESVEMFLNKLRIHYMD